jgi:hypothetical protein
MLLMIPDLTRGVPLIVFRLLYIFFTTHTIHSVTAMYIL